MSGCYQNSGEDAYHERMLNRHLDDTYGDNEEFEILGEDDPPQPIDIIYGWIPRAEGEVFTMGYLYENGDFESEQKTYKKGEWRRS